MPAPSATAITGHLHERNIDPEVVAWDAWRREDGRWALTGRFTIQGRDGLAELTFDQPGNFVVLDNDDARWLVGDVPDPVAEPEPEPGARRLAAVPAEDEHQLTLGDDVLGITDEPIEAFLDDQPGLDETELVEEAADAAALDEDPDSSDPRAARSEDPRAGLGPAGTRSCSAERCRSRPAWDEIMFGASPGEPESRRVTSR